MKNVSHLPVDRCFPAYDRRSKICIAALRFSLLSAVAACCIGVGLSALGPDSAQAQSPPDSTDRASATEMGGFRGSGRPLGRTSGGSRGACLDQIIALVPGTGTVSEGENCVLSTALPGKTRTGSPTLWFYIPAATTDRTAEFVLLNENEQPIGPIATIPLSQTAGLMGVPLPSPLAAHQAYHWVFSVLADDRSPSQNPTVEGIVERVSADRALDQQLATARSLADRVTLYQTYDLWQDALTELVQWRCTEPTNPQATSAWAAFLQTAHLQALANAPILSCEAVKTALQPVAH